MEDDEEDDCIGAVSFPSSIHWYIAFRATERFRNVYSRFPGSCEDSKEMIESDTSHLIQHALELTNEWGIDKSLIEKDCLLEMYA